MTVSQKTKVAIIGSGNIGTDLMIKILRLSDTLEVAAMVGIDPESDGLKRADRMKVPTTSDGVAGLIAMPGFDEIRIVLDATSARAHVLNAEKLAPYDKHLIDLTPAAIGPYLVPAVNMAAHQAERNVNMVTCGGQATIPIVAAVSSVATVEYAEIVASISSASAGPGTRANIDEFTETTRAGLEQVGGARQAKAIIILNPAEPPMVMRDTVLCLVDRDADQAAIRAAVVDMVERVSAYVPGYRLKQEVQFSMNPYPVGTAKDEQLQVSVYLEVEGAAHYLPSYAGNLDIMTSAAVQVAEVISARLVGSVA